MIEWNELSDKAKENIKYKETDFITRDTSNAVYAYCEVTKEAFGGRTINVRFLIMDRHEYWEAAQNVNMDFESSFLESVDDQIIIGGHFYYTKYQEPIMYMDWDMSKRTPTREYLSDWMETFNMIQHFVITANNVHNITDLVHFKR